MTGATALCPNGHGMPANQRFCSECGSPLANQMPRSVSGIPGQSPPPSFSHSAQPLTILELFFSPRGRIGRQAFWLGMLTIAGLTALLTIAINMSGFVPSGDSPMSLAPGLIYGAFSVSAGVNLLIKRFHDGDRSGWWSILAFITIVNLWVLLVCGIDKGTQGPNRFGPATNQTPFG